MTPASRRGLLPSAFNLFVGLLRCHENLPELKRCLAAASAAAHACTRRHALVTVTDHTCSRGFTVMAHQDSGTLRHQEKTQQQQQQQDQPLQQGVAVAPASPQRGLTGFKKTFYKRKLPSPPAIEFSSPEGRQLFQEALLEGSMVGFFKLMEQFNTQDEPAFCGLASLAMTLNALSIDPRRTWKGSWRWFHEAMLDCCRPLDSVKQEGITLYQAYCLARCNGARVELRPHGSTSVEDFRAEVAAVCRSGEEHIVVSYSRKAFLQTGDGHFSPIGGYHRQRDLVLVLDVARFKYPPHWVPLSLLYDAMAYIDPETSRPRGYMRLASNPLLDSVLLTLDLRSDAWRPADAFMRAEAPALVEALAAQGGLSGEDVVRRVIDAMPVPSLDAFLIVRSGAPLAASAASAGGATEATTTDDATTTTTKATASPATCGPTPEALAAAVQLASDTANAAAAATQIRSTSGSVPPSTAAIPSSTKSCTGSGGGGAASAAKSSSCGSCGTGVDGEGAAAATAAAKTSSCGSSSTSRLMAAAAAVFTAQDRCIPLAQRQQLLDELRGMPLYSLVSNHLAATAAATAATTASSSLSSSLSRGQPPAAAAAAAAPPPATRVPQLPQEKDLAAEMAAAPQRPEYLAEKMTMALLIMARPEEEEEVGPRPERWADPEAGKQWRALTALGGYSVVEAEAAYLREQLQHIDEVLQSGSVQVTCREHTSRLDCAAHGH